MCQGCVKGVSRVCQGCVKDVSRMCQGCVKGVSRMCQGCVKDGVKDDRDSETAVPQGYWKSQGWYCIPLFL